MAALAVIASLLPISLAGQAVYDRGRGKEPGAKTWLERKAKLPPYTPNRTPDGQPDLQGRWGGSSSGDILEATDYIDMTTPPSESWVSDPADGRIPYQPWALAKRDEHRKGLGRGWPGESGERLYADPQTFCLKSVPRYAQRGFELAQIPGYVIVMLNWGHYYRAIPLDDRPHTGNTAKFWMGNSRGRWEGDTLVVDVTNLNADMWLDSVGNFHSANAHIIERFRLADANNIDYEVTIEDPTVYTRPWKLNYVLRRAGTGGRGENQANNEANDPYANESWEHACHEGNGHHVEGTQSLGFKWYKAVVPPGNGSR